MLEVAFVRRRGGRDRVYVTRADGTSTGWDFPSYGDWLPHDLCHLLVEEEFGLTDGFWGLVDRGVEVGLVDNQAMLMREGKPLVEHAGFDLRGLMEAEAAVAALTGPAAPDAGALPAVTPPEAVTTVTSRLETLAAQWRALDDGGAITLEFSSGANTATLPGVDRPGRHQASGKRNGLPREQRPGSSPKARRRQRRGA